MYKENIKYLYIANKKVQNVEAIVCLLTAKFNQMLMGINEQKWLCLPTKAICICKQEDNKV